MGQPPLTGGTTAKRTFAVVPIHSKGQRFEYSSRGLPIRRRIFAAGYLRLRARRKLENRLANASLQSVHSHEVYSVETRDGLAPKIETNS